MKHLLISLVAVDARPDQDDRGAEGPRPVRSAPPYGQVVPPHRLLASEEQEVEGQKVRFAVKSYRPFAVVVEARAEVPDIFDAGILPFKRSLLEGCHSRARAHSRPGALAEEYTLYCVAGYGDLGPLVEAHKPAIVRLLHSEAEEMDAEVVESTLATASLKYSADDLAVVGWDGAVIFAEEHELPETAEILTLANLQLLKLRVLDREVETLLEGFRDPRGTRRWVRGRGTLGWILQARTHFLLDFENIRRDINLFGDWYTGKLYALASRRLHLEEKTEEVKERLDTLEDLYEMVSRRVSDLYTLVLEAAIVGLFVVEVVRAFLIR